MEGVSLTAVVLTYNEAHRIENCLCHLSWVDEILVIDSGSRDGTVEICRQWPNTRVVQRLFDTFASQRNAGIEAAQGVWILIVDADEEVPTSLTREIQECLQDELEAYWIPRLNVVFGKPIRFGECLRDGQVRLFRKGTAHYTGMIHETLAFAGRAGRLQSPLVHHSFENVSEWMHKMNRYTSDEVERFVAEGQRFHWAALLLGPWVRFVRFFVLRQGWRDGWVGFLYAALGSFYFFVKQLKFRERLVWGREKGVSVATGGSPD